MTDERDKPSRKESSARTTARDVPFVRDAGSDAEPVPRGKRPAQLPRDPTYEAELAQVELAVLRNPDRRDDPSTKQGGRRGYHPAPIEAPESVTPESPGTRQSRESAHSTSPSPPSSGGRSAASGTLLSIGAVDPRAKTERTLETPRMYFSQVDAAGEVYFKPGKIPAVTVHQTLETETVKLADSIDPRRAKTMPRIDRQALARYMEGEHPEESAAPSVLAGPGSSVDFADEPPSLGPQRVDDYDPVSSLGEGDTGQIHASLSPFRDHAEPSYTFDGVPTLAEPLAARRASDIPASLPPEPSAVPTHRDLPMHRIEASLPPPPALPSIASPSDPMPTRATAHAPAASEMPGSLHDPVELEEGVRKPIWTNLTAFGVALLLTIVLGLWLTRSPDAPAPLPAAPQATTELAAPLEPAPVLTTTAAELPESTEPVAPSPERATATPPSPERAAATPPSTASVATPPSPSTASVAPSLAAQPQAVTPSTDAPRKPSSPSSSLPSSRKPTTTKVPPRETIF